MNLQFIGRLCGNVGGSRSSDYSLPTAIAITASSILVSELDKALLREGCDPGGGGVPEKSGGGVRPASQNPYPIYDQNLRFSLPYL